MSNGLTKIQLKSRERILAWLDNKPFIENSRAKPEVPELTAEEILRDYCPDNIEARNKYYTPDSARAALFRVIPQLELPPVVRVLDPAAGIGHLLKPLTEQYPWNITAIEIDEEDKRIGERLFPNVAWYCMDALDLPAHNEIVQDGFDLVVMNPPFNGSGTFREPGSTQYLTNRTDRMFLEMAMRVLKPQGYVLTAGTYNLFNVSKKAQAYLDSVIEFNRSLGELPGTTRFTSVVIHGYLCRKRAAAPKKEWDGNNEQWQVPVPQHVYNQLLEFNGSGKEFLPDFKQSVKLLDELGYGNASHWLAQHPKDFEYLYFYGAKLQA